MNYRDHRNALAVALAPLGNTPEEVAATLEKEGVKGGKTCYNCPIYHYLEKVNPVLARTGWYTYLLDGKKDDNNFDVVLAFITAYDKGAFSNLRW